MKINWKKTLATVAPALAGALGSPVAAVAVKVACDALGLSEGATEADLEAAVASGNPDILLKLKTAEQDFVLKMEELGIDRKKLNVQDRSGARDLAKTKGILPQAVLSGIFVAGYFIVFTMFLNAVFGGQKMETEFIALVSGLIGIMSAAVTQIMNFWFGSSSGSKQKTELMKASG